MDYNEFSEKIKAKYPQYKDIDNKELAQKIIAKYPQYQEQVTFEEPQIEKQGGIDLTPSGLIEKGANAAFSAVATPIEMIRSKETNPIEAFKNVYGQNEQNMAIARKKSPVLSGAANFGTDLLGYSALPVLKGGGIAGGIGNAVVQGGLPMALESLKKDEDVLGGALGGTALVGGLNTAISATPYVGKIVKNVIANPDVQKGVGKSLEALTSVPQEYSQRALDAELAGNSLFNGKFDKKTAYRPIEEKITQAKEMLPTAENYADEFYKLGQKVKTNIENIKEAAGNEISDMLGSLRAEPIQINGLKNSIDSLVKSYAKGGNINPAEVRAGRDLELVRDMLGMNDKKSVASKLSEYLQSNKFGNTGNEAKLGKDAENAAFDILSQVTGKNKRWLQSQLNANMPKMSTQKRQEFIESLLENVDDKIETGTIDPTWTQYFPELFQVGERYGINGQDVARKLFDRIVGKDLRASSELLSPSDMAINEVSKQYDNLINQVANNPTSKGIDASYDKLQDILSYSPEGIKDDLVMKYANDIENIQDIVNPKIKPIDLHNAKEILYDMANYDTAGGTRNDVLKGVANQINNFLRTKYPQYKAPNDKFAMIKTLENNLGGINSSTIANKLANYNSAGNIASGLDQRLRDINNILPLNQQFINDAKNLVNSRNEVNNILKTISQKYEDNARPLADKTSQRFENAINKLQDMTGVNFMNDLNNVRAREALEQLFPGQGGGSGSSQGFGNLLRTALIGGAPTAALLMHNPAALAGLASVSPKFMAQGTIKNLGKIYRNADKKLPDNVQRVLRPLAIKLLAQ